MTGPDERHLGFLEICWERLGSAMQDWSQGKSGVEVLGITAPLPNLSPPLFLFLPAFKATHGLDLPFKVLTDAST